MEHKYTVWYTTSTYSLYTFRCTAKNKRSAISQCKRNMPDVYEIVDVEMEY